MQKLIVLLLMCAHTLTMFPSAGAAGASAQEERKQHGSVLEGAQFVHSPSAPGGVDTVEALKRGTHELVDELIKDKDSAQELMDVLQFFKTDKKRFKPIIDHLREQEQKKSEEQERTKIRQAGGIDLIEAFNKIEGKVFGENKDSYTRLTLQEFLTQLENRIKSGAGSTARTAITRKQETYKHNIILDMLALLPNKQYIPQETSEKAARFNKERADVHNRVSALLREKYKAQLADKTITYGQLDQLAQEAVNKEPAYQAALKEWQKFLPPLIELYTNMYNQAKAFGKTIPEALPTPDALRKQMGL